MCTQKEEKEMKERKKKGRREGGEHAAVCQHKSHPTMCHPHRQSPGIHLTARPLDQGRPPYSRPGGDCVSQSPSQSSLQHQGHVEILSKANSIRSSEVGAQRSWV